MKGKKFKNLLQLILKIIIIIFKILFFFLFISLLLSILINTCFCMPESRSSNPGDGNAGAALISIILIIIGAAIAIVYDSTKHDTSTPQSPPQSPSASMLNLENFEKNFPNPNKSINIPDIVDNKLYIIFYYCSFSIFVLSVFIAFYHYNFLGFKNSGEKYKLKIKHNFPRFYKYFPSLIVLFCWSIFLFVSIYNK